MDFFSIQLEFIQFIQTARSPALDFFIKLFDFFDRQEFIFILIPLVWLGYGSRVGIKVFYLLALSHIANHELKNLFALPRPFHLEPSVGIIPVSGFGFPSGAAQNAILFSGLLTIYWKNHWKWAVAILFTFLLSFSRIYLGVHFPMDILGGWAVGFLLLGIYLTLFPRVESFIEQRSVFSSLLLNFAFPAALILLFPTKKAMSIGACAMGLGLGMFLSRLVGQFNSIPKTRKVFFARVTVGIIGIFLLNTLAFKIFKLQSSASIFLLFFGIGLWISLGAISFCNLLSLLFTSKIRLQKKD